MDDLQYNSKNLQIDLDFLRKLYPFLEIGSIGKSILGRNIPYIKIGKGHKQVFYSASFHANEWITSVVLMKFIEDYCIAYVNNTNLFGYNIKNLFKK